MLIYIYLTLQTRVFLGKHNYQRIDTYDEEQPAQSWVIFKFYYEENKLPDQ